MTSFYGIILFIIVFIAVMVIASLSTPNKKAELPNNISDDLIAEVALNGDKSKAIQWYQQFHHVRLMEARRAVETLIKGETPQPTVRGNISEDDIRAVLKEGKKIEAIKMYRELHLVGLKEAKDAVELMMEQA